MTASGSLVQMGAHRSFQASMKRWMAVMGSVTVVLVDRVLRVLVSLGTAE
jgi:hypothetical protein